MKNDRYFKLRIPFGTKGYIQNLSDSIVIKGNAIFIFDTVYNHYIDSYLELEKANFRLTDLKMIKPTAYYKKKAKEFRDQYLDPWSNLDPEMINKKILQELTDEQIKILNVFFKKQNTTIRNMFSWLSGSNPTGAKKNPNNSPIRCIDNDFFDCNFANPLKEFEAKKSKWTKNYPNDLPTYTLMDIWNNDLIKDFKRIFSQYNQNHEILLEENTENNLIQYDKNNLIDVFKKHEEKNFENNSVEKETFELPEKQELYISSLTNKTIDNFEKLIANDFEAIKKNLRRFYKKNVDYCLENQIIPLKSMTMPKKHYEIQSAHIISFAKAIRNQEYRVAIDPFNCLRIDSNIHAKFDKSEIYFDKDGNVCSSIDHEIWIANYIDIKNMHYKTKKYFESQTKKTNKTIK